MVEPVKNVVAQVVDKVKEVTTISKDFNTNLELQIPKNAPLQDSSTKVVQSPWGNSVLLKSFGNADAKSSSTGGSAYLNIYCVNCGVTGHAAIAGKASWTPVGGFTEGQVSLTVDLNVILKLGIDAQLLYSKEFNNQLFAVALPGLEYGVVKIGPTVSLGTSSNMPSSTGDCDVHMYANSRI